MTHRAVPHDVVIFDCDGTLVGTQNVWNRAYAALCRRYGKTLSRPDRHSLIGLQLDALGHALARLLDQPGKHAALGAEIYAMVADNIGDAITPLPGAVDLVMALSHHNRPLAVASNTPAAIVNHYLTTIGLVNAFDVVIGSDDVSRPKPAPDIYLAACARLRVDPIRSVAVEDSPTGVTAARAAGMYVVGVPSTPDLNLAVDATYPTLADLRLHHALGVSQLSGAARRGRVA